MASIAESAAAEWGFPPGGKDSYTGFIGARRLWAPKEKPKVKKGEMYPRIVEFKDHIWINGPFWTISILGDPVTGNFKMTRKGRIGPDDSKHISALFMNNEAWRELIVAWTQDQQMYDQAPYLRKIPGVSEGPKTPVKKSKETVSTGLDMTSVSSLPLFQSSTSGSTTSTPPKVSTRRRRAS